MNSVTARAHTNIALIKYWGKKDPTLFLPYNSSLSLTLDAFFTDTTVQFAEQDSFYLNHKLQDDVSTKKVFQFVELFRSASGILDPIRIDSINHVPTAAGLASSASAYAALAMGLNDLYELNFDKKTLSTYARRGSGSATRSLFGGFVEWKKGHSNETSYAEQIDSADWDIAMLICLVNGSEKKVSSREGMQRTVDTSPFYPDWVTSSQMDLSEMKKAIHERDFNSLGEIAERSALKMHATMLSANPPFTYFEPKSIATIQRVQQLREQGIPCYITMDAGPNVKIICQSASIEAIQTHLNDLFTPHEMITAYPGPGANIISENHE